MKRDTVCLTPFKSNKSRVFCSLGATTTHLYNRGGWVVREGGYKPHTYLNSLLL